MKKEWKLKLACPLGEAEDTKEILMEGVNEEETLTNLENLPSSDTHCVHGPLKVIDLTLYSPE